MRVKLSEKYQIEREDICKRLIDILYCNLLFSLNAEIIIRC